MKLATLILAACVIGLAGCATKPYDGPPLEVADHPDTYRFKVQVGTFSGEKAALDALKPELEEFKTKGGFTSYRVVDQAYNLPSYMEFTVKFYR